MTATLTRTAPSTSTVDRSAKTPSLLRPGTVAGLAAAAATVACAVIASAAGVPLEISGEQIPALGFGQLTLVCTAIGVLIAQVLRSGVRTPRTTFTKTAIVLTAVSLVPDVVVAASTATRLTLMLTHVVAAAIVIPALSSRLPRQN